MPYPSLTWPQTLDTYTRQELEQFISLLQGYLSAQHDENGAHTAITATSVAATGDVTGDSDGLLPTSIGALGTPPFLNGLGSAGVNIGDKWWLRAMASSGPGSGADYELQLWDRTNSTNAAVLRVVFDGTNVVLMPGSGSVLPVNFGTSSSRINHVHAAAATIPGTTTAGAVNVTGALDAQSGVRTFGRSTVDGDAITVAYNAANFTASAGTWTVDAGDQFSFVYTLNGRFMTVFFEIGSTDVSAAPAFLKFAIPGGKTVSASMQTRNPIYISNAGVLGNGFAYAAPSASVIELYPNSGNWTTTAADNTSALGQISFITA